jgi:hypothetical protein
VFKPYEIAARPTMKAMARTASMMIPRLLGYAAAAAVGLTIQVHMFPPVFATGGGVHEACQQKRSVQLGRTLTYCSRLDEFDRLYRKTRSELVMKAYDAEADLALPHAMYLSLEKRPDAGGECLSPVG